MSAEIVLYDLACKGRCACWSANVWKSRLALNYKGVPYRTEWLSYADMGEKLKDVVPEPNASGSPYTVPTVQFADSNVVMDSAKIAVKLENAYPEPSLRLDTGLHDAIMPIIGKALLPLRPVFMPRVARDIIIEPSVAKFRESRNKMFGMPLEEAERVKGGETAWQAAEPGLKELGKFLKEHKIDEGPFILGSQVSYVDFIVAALLVGMKRMGEDLYDKLVSYDEGLSKHYEACEKWMEKDQ